LCREKGKKTSEEKRGPQPELDHEREGGGKKKKKKRLGELPARRRGGKTLKNQHSKKRGGFDLGEL